MCEWCHVAGGFGGGEWYSSTSIMQSEATVEKRCKWQPMEPWSFEAATRQYKEFDYQRENRAWMLNEQPQLGKWDWWTRTNLATHRGAALPKTEGMLNISLHLI